jgi:hypothetical protein
LALSGSAPQLAPVLGVDALLLAAGVQPSARPVCLPPEHSGEPWLMNSLPHLSQVRLVPMAQASLRDCYHAAQLPEGRSRMISIKPNIRVGLLLLFGA